MARIDIVQANPPVDDRISSRNWRWVINVAILLFGLTGAYRLEQRVDFALGLSSDIRPSYLSARAWGQGVNPYRPQEQLVQWAQVRPPGEPDLPDWEFTRELAVYPPPTLALLYPLTLLPWAALRIVWVIISLVLSLLAWLALIRMLEMPITGWRALLFGALWLSLGPFVTALGLANPALPAAMLCVLVVYLAAHRRWLLGGIALGLAVVIKPQMGLALLLFYVLQPRPRVWLVATGLLILLSAIGVGRLWVAHVDWMPTLHASIQAINGPGGFNDASYANYQYRWQLINLQLLLFGFLSNRALVNGLTMAIVLALGGLFMLAWKRGGRRTDDALLASVPLILALMPVYHRYYDAAVLVIPLGVAITLLGTRRNWHAVGILICTAPFYISGAFVLDNFQHSSYMSDRLLHSVLWNVFLLPTQTWMLLAMTLILIHLIWVTKKRDDQTPVAAGA